MIKRERHTDHAFVVRFTPDGSTVITSGPEGSVKFSSFCDCHVSRREEGYISKLVYSRDGKKMIGAFKEEGRLRVWDMNQSTEGGGDVFDLEGHEKGILWLVVGKDNEVVSASQDKMIKVWNVDTKSCRLTLTGKTLDERFCSKQNLYIERPRVYKTFYMSCHETCNKEIQLLKCLNTAFLFSLQSSYLHLQVIVHSFKNVSEDGTM